MRTAAAWIVAAVLVASCSSSAPPVRGSAAGWPMFRGDLFRDGHPAGATLTIAQAKNLKTRWSHTLPGQADGTPVVVNGLVYVASFGGRLDAYHLDDGAQAWSDDGLGAISGTPAISGKTIVVATLTGKVHALDAGDGRKLWDWSAPGSRPALWSSPAIYRRTVVVGVGSQYGDSPLEAGRVVALDLATGTEHWDMCVRPRCAAGSGVWSTAAIDDGGHGYVGTGNPDDEVIAFDLGSGQRLWTTVINQDKRRDLDVGATPIVIQRGGREYIATGSNAGVFALLNAGDGKVVWSRQLVQGSAVHGLIASPAYDGKAIYVASASAPTGVFALNPLTGETLWQRGIGMPIYSALAVADGVVVFGAGDQAGGKGGVYGVSTADGALVFAFDNGRAVLSGPSIVGSTVLAADAGGNVLVFSP